MRRKPSQVTFCGHGKNGGQHQMPSSVFPALGFPYHPPVEHLGRVYDAQTSVVDLLPLRPTAQVFTFDPAANEWVPRARPQET